MPRAAPLWLVAQFPAPLRHPGCPRACFAVCDVRGWLGAEFPALLVHRPFGAGVRGAPGPALPGADLLWLGAQFPAPLRHPGCPRACFAVCDVRGWLGAEFPALLVHRPFGAGVRGAPGPALPGADLLWLGAQFPAPLRG